MVHVSLARRVLRREERGQFDGGASACQYVSLPFSRDVILTPVIAAAASHRFANVLVPATGGLPHGSEYVCILLRRGCSWFKPSGYVPLFAAIWNSSPQQFRTNVF
jgi:hypothetical protein